MPVYLSDTFSGELSGTPLQSHTPDIGGAWSKLSGDNLVISSGARCRYGGLGTGGFNFVDYSNAVVPTSADQAISADLVPVGVAGSEFWRLTTRWSAADTCYAVLRSHLEPSGRGLVLEKRVGGVATELGVYDAGNVPAGGERTELISSGSSHQALLDGVVRLAATDSGVTQVGGHNLAYLNFALAGSDLTGLHLDNLVAAALVSVARPLAASWETVIPAASAKVGAVEAQAGTAAQFTAPVEAAVGRVASRLAPLEALSAASVAGSALAPFEALLAGVDAESQFPAESQATTTSQAAAALEAIAGLLAARGAVWEASSPAGVLAFRELPLESLASTQAAALNPWETLVGAAVTAGVPLEALVGLLAAKAAVWEALTPAAVAAVAEAPFETLATLAAARDTLWESLVLTAAIIVAADLPFETQQTLTTELALAWEATGGLAVSADAPFETTLPQSFTQTIVWETQVPGAAIATLRLESLGTARGCETWTYSGDGALTYNGGETWTYDGAGTLTYNATGGWTYSGDDDPNLTYC